MSTGGQESVGGLEAELRVVFDKASQDLRQYEAELRKTKQEIEYLEDALAMAAASGGKGYTQLRAQLDQARAAEQALTQAIRDQQAALARTQAAMDGTATATTKISAGMAGVTQQSAKMGTGFMQIAYFMDDMKYGISALVNQMPQLGMAFGQAFGLGTETSMKLGSALGIGAVAVRTWVDSWGSAKELLADLGWLDTLTDKLDALKKSLTDPAVGHSWLGGLAGQGLQAVEVAGQMQKAQAEAAADQAARQKAIADVGAMRTPEAEATGKAIKETMGTLQGGPQQLLEDLYRQQATGPAYTLPAGADTATKRKVKEAQDLLRGNLARMITEAIGGDEASQRSLFAVSGDTEFGRQYQFHAPGYQEQIKRGAKAEEERAKQEQKEADDYRQAQEKAAQERADQLAKGTLGYRASVGRPVTPKDVRAALKDAGETDEAADFMVGEVYDRFTKAVAESVRKRALETGQSEDEVRRDLMAEHADKIRQTQAKERRELMGKAESAFPALARTARQGVLEGQLMGMSPQQAEQFARAKLQSGLGDSGLTREETSRVSAEAIRDALKAEQQQAATGQDPRSSPEAAMRFLGIPGAAMRQQDLRAPEFVNPAEMFQKVQLAALEPQDKSERFLADLVSEAQTTNKLLESIKGGVPAQAV